MTTNPVSFSRKIIFAAAAFGIFSFLLLSVVRAADYSLTLSGGGNVNWDSAPWAAVPGPGGGIPGSEDRILDLANQGSVTNFRLNGDKSVLSLQKQTAGNFRIYNQTSANAEHYTLNITESMSVKDGVLSFRGQGGGLTILTPELTLGSDIAGSTGRIDFGGSDTYPYVTFEVAGVTKITGYNSAVILGSSLSPSASTINLGHVIFEPSQASVNEGSPGFQIGSGVLTVKSLRNTGEWTRPTIRGAGTLLIAGNSGDSTQPEGENRFGLAILESVRVEKSGSNLQILSRADGNSYSGGTMISGGVLAIQNSAGSGLGTGSVEVRNSGILAGNGQILLEDAAVTVKIGGSVAPGAAGEEGFHKLLINGAEKGTSNLLEMEQGSAFSFNIDASGNSDSISFAHYTAGDLVLAAGGIIVNVTGSLAADTTYTLFTFNSGAFGTFGDTNSGLSSGLVMGSGFDGFTATFHYDAEGYGGVGVISMTASAVPEPSVAACCVITLAFGVLFWSKRRRVLRQL